MKNHLAGMAGAALVLSMGLGAPAELARGTESAPVKATVVFSEALPPLQGSQQAVSMIVVTYPPGGQSEPHTHPGPVLGYVLEGSVEMQLAGGSPKIYRAGEAFSEPVGSVHLISWNASATRTAKLLAFIFVRHAPSPAS